jgi:hypothetical protein
LAEPLNQAAFLLADHGVADSGCEEEAGEFTFWLQPVQKLQ